MVQIPVQPNKRYTFIGKTRSGKSFLTWVLLRHFFKADPDLQIVFIDPKFERKKFGSGATMDAPKLVKRYEKNTRVQVFQTHTWIPDLDDMVDQVMKRSKVIVVLDELGGLATANTVPVGITRLWTQGGGKGVGAWAMLQFPKRCPRVIKSQSELFFMFRITDKKDRQDMLDFIPDERIVEAPLPKKYFWIYSDDMDYAIKIRPVKVPATEYPK